MRSATASTISMVLSLVAGRREEEGRLDEALALLRRAPAAAPEAIGIMNAIGLCLNRLGRFEEAVADYGAALARDPAFAPALANRGDGADGAGPARARRGGDFEAAAAIDPAQSVAAERAGGAGAARAATRPRRGGWPSAVLAREPGFPGAVMTLAGADLAEGRAGEAEAALGALLGDRRGSTRSTGRSPGACAATRSTRSAAHAEAFAAWSEAECAAGAIITAPAYEGRPGTLALVRDADRGARRPAHPRRLGPWRAQPGQGATSSWSAFRARARR